MLAAAAKVLAARRGELAGRVLFMFQPGEEGYHGARYMLEEGLLDPDKVGHVTHAFAVHQIPRLPSGMIATRPGTFLASSDTFRVVVNGRGGHAAAPWYAHDPIPVACEIVQAIQTAIARRINVFDPAVVSVAQVIAGTTVNVIPETAELRGTMRAMSEDTRCRVIDMLRRIVDGIAGAHEMSVTVAVDEGYPVTVNDKECAEWVLDVAAALFGGERVIRMPTPGMASEDFSYVLNQVPGAIVFLGACPPGTDPRHAAINHSNRMVMDEVAMATGIEMYTQVALRTLA